MGPGDSARSHSADEYVYLSEVEEAIEIYGKMIECIAL
jgi:acetylornithine deacetylase